jgi:hypothetical protein
MLRTFLRFFDLRDLEKDDWRRLGGLFLELAEILAKDLPDNETARIAMQKLLEAKDATIRSQIQEEDRIAALEAPDDGTRVA